MERGDKERASPSIPVSTIEWIRRGNLAFVRALYVVAGLRNGRCW